MQLPVANSKTVLAYAKVLIREHRAALARMLSLYAFAAVMALVPAWVIGEITNFASYHQLSERKITDYVGLLVVASLAYALLTYFARRRSYVLGETVFAQLREEFLQSVLALPLSDVERAGTGDLLSRTTNDMESLSRTVRFAVPEWLVAILQAVLTMGAMLLVSPLASVASLVSLPVLFFSTRYYLRYATPGYRRERMSYATMSGSVAETAEGARTINAHRRAAKGDPHRGQRPRIVLLRDVHAVDAHDLVSNPRRGRVRPGSRRDARLERVARDPTGTSRSAPPRRSPSTSSRSTIRSTASCPGSTRFRSARPRSLVWWACRSSTTTEPRAYRAFQETITWRTCATHTVKAMTSSTAWTSWSARASDWPLSDPRAPVSRRSDD